MRVFFDDNSMRLKLVGLRNERTGEAIADDAEIDVSADLYDASAGAVVAGSAIALEPIEGQPGDWDGVFPASLDTPRGPTSCLVRVTADGGDYLTGYWEIPVTVRRRQ